MAAKDSSSTDLNHFMDHANAGVLREKIEAVLSEVARGVVNHGQGRKKGEVTLTLKISNFGEPERGQVMIEHELKNVIPTKRGKKSEQDITESVFFAGRGGKLTFEQPKVDDQDQFGLVDKATGEVLQRNSG